MEIRFQVDSANRPDCENAITQSLAKGRSQVVTSFYDDILEQADDVGKAIGGGLFDIDSIINIQ